MTLSSIVEADTLAILNDTQSLGLGVPVVIGTTQLVGIVQHESRDVLTILNAAGVSGTIITVTVQTSQLPSPLPNRTVLTVDGVNMVLRNQTTEGDGVLTHLLCEKA